MGFECCNYKISRRALLVLNMIILIFAIAFIGVGSVSIIFGKSFGRAINDYCVKICSAGREGENSDVGCNCDSSPPQTTIPIVAIQAPAAGIVAVGVFLLLASLLGCIGAVREKPKLIFGFIVVLFLIIIMQFGFGVAAGTVASGNAPQATGPLVGALNQNYRRFDWKMLEGFFQPSCYYASETAILHKFEGDMNYTFYFPACDFYGQCSSAQNLSSQEVTCCRGESCDTSNPYCESGNQCVVDLLGKIAAPVAVVAFLALCIEIAALVFAFNIRKGNPAGKYGV